MCKKPIGELRINLERALDEDTGVRLLWYLYSLDCDQTSQTRKISLPQPFPYAPKTSLTLDRLCFVDESRANSYLASQKARNNLTRSMKEDCRCECYINHIQQDAIRIYVYLHQILCTLTYVYTYVLI